LISCVPLAIRQYRHTNFDWGLSLFYPAMKTMERTVIDAPVFSNWHRVLMGAILAAPFALAAGGFQYLPAQAQQCLASWLAPLRSVPVGFVIAPLWQCTVLIGWFIVFCLYLAGIDDSFRRRQLVRAGATITLVFCCSAFLLYQQNCIAVITADLHSR
jgi:hypothetical protein